MNTERLEKLCSTFGVSSAERNISYVLEAKYQKLGYEIIKDRLGSCFAYKASNNKDAETLMIACPMDEPGLMIKAIEDDKAYFICLENIALNSLLHQRVEILTADDEIVYGIISTKAKAYEDKCEIKSADDLYIQILNSKEKLRPGDLVSYASNYLNYGGYVVSKALYPRVLNEIELSLLEKIADKDFDFNIVIGTVAQSIIGFRGTKTATYVVKPDLALALSCYDGAKMGEIYAGYYDTGMLPDNKLLNDFVQATKAKPHFGKKGNDGSFIHKTLSGTPCIALGIGVSAMGSGNEAVCLKDGEKLTDALGEFLANLSSAKIREYSHGR